MKTTAGALLVILALGLSTSGCAATLATVAALGDGNTKIAEAPLFTATILDGVVLAHMGEHPLAILALVDLPFSLAFDVASMPFIGLAKIGKSLGRYRSHDPDPPRAQAPPQPRPAPEQRPPPALESDPRSTLRSEFREARPFDAPPNLKVEVR